MRFFQADLLGWDGESMGWPDGMPWPAAPKDQKTSELALLRRQLMVKERCHQWVSWLMDTRFVDFLPEI